MPGVLCGVGWGFLGLLFLLGRPYRIDLLFAVDRWRRLCGFISFLGAPKNHLVQETKPHVISSYYRRIIKVR